MALRYFFDECTDEDVARALISLSVDVVTVSGLKRKGIPDPEQFDFANQENRVIYSTDHDFLIIAWEHMAQGKGFPGLVFHAPGTRSKRQIIDALFLLNEVLEPQDMVNQVEYI